MRGTSWEEVRARMGGSWQEQALLALRRLAEQQEEFTSETLKPLLPPAVELRALGGVFSAAQRDGLIEPTGRYASPGGRTASHGRPQRVWRSLILAEKEGVQ